MNQIERPECKDCNHYPVCKEELMSNLSELCPFYEKFEPLKELECCGNCSLFETINCPLRSENPNYKDEITYPESHRVCDNWEFDRKSHKKRMVV